MISSSLAVYRYELKKSFGIGTTIILDLCNSLSDNFTIAD